MRDYLYIWHDTAKQMIVASGIEFRDLIPYLKTRGGVVLIEHRSETAFLDRDSGFHFASRSGLLKLSEEDAASWGEFAWVDYAAEAFPLIPAEEIAELLYFGHKAMPLRRAVLPSLGNQFMGFAHDGDWYLRLYYANWKQMADLLIACASERLGSLSISELQKGVHGFWLRGGRVDDEEMTHDVDRVLDRRL